MTSTTPKPRAGEHVEPWRVGQPRDSSGVRFIEEGDHATIGKIYDEGDARRIVACVNACEGIPDEALPDALHNAREQDSAIRSKVETNLIAAERDDLAKALEVCDKAIRGVIGDGPVRGNGTPYPVWADMISAAVQARALLAKHGR